MLTGESGGANDDVVRLGEPARLVCPTVAVRESWLAAERADIEQDGIPDTLLMQAGEDFEGFVARRQGVRVLWDVPTTILWYVSGSEYIGELVIRHELTAALLESGGHIGYGIATPWRRQGHGTRLLADGLVECRRMGLKRVLVTCDGANEGSRRVILANGGVFEDSVKGEDRFWITLD